MLTSIINVVALITVAVIISIAVLLTQHVKRKRNTDNASTKKGVSAGDKALKQNKTTNISKSAKTSKASNKASKSIGKESSSVFSAILSSLSKSALTTDDWNEIERALLSADMGTKLTKEIIDNLKLSIKKIPAAEKTPAKVKLILKEMLVDSLTTENTSELASAETPPTVIIVVGVNGVGKTTTIGKLTKLLDTKSIVLGAADTFRAAASEQLTTWATQSGVEIVKAEKDGQDSASVAYSTIDFAIKNNLDYAIVDTAGRLHNKENLMQELSKVKRVIEKLSNVDEVLLVIDATTGQTAFSQAKQFLDITQVSGIVLTKLDGSAKGGIIFKIHSELGIPVKFIGTGEGIDDLSQFEPKTFVEGILGE
jgi:fused signal recognition particle receptor